MTTPAPTHLFATILSPSAPSRNYGGEREANRSIIQKIAIGEENYPIISSESLRSALREMLGEDMGLPCNRSRLPDADQPSVIYSEYPNPEKFIDDFLFGYFIAKGGDERDEIRRKVIYSDEDPRGNDLRDSINHLNKELNDLKKTKTEPNNAPGDVNEVNDKANKTTKRNTDPQIKKKEDEIKAKLKELTDFAFKRDSLLRMNLALGLSPYRNSTVFSQSPYFDSPSPWQNSESSGLLHAEIAHTAFQFPFAINLLDCLLIPGPNKTTKLHPKGKDWTLALIKAIADLSGVAGKQTLSLFPMGAASVVVRLTARLAPGYDLYGFQMHRQDLGPDILPSYRWLHKFPELADINLPKPQVTEPTDPSNPAATSATPSAESPQPSPHSGDNPTGDPLINTELLCLGGRIVRDMTKEERTDARKRGFILFDDSAEALLYAAKAGLANARPLAEQKTKVKSVEDKENGHPANAGSPAEQKAPASSPA